MIDCPPSLGLLTVNALVAADYALLSAEAQYFALQGVEQALEVIELARDNLNPGLEWLGVMLNIADMRTRHSREAFDSLRQHFGDKLLDTTIRASIAYAESAERAQSILDYRPDLATDYLNVADELLRRLGMDARRAARALAAGWPAPRRHAARSRAISAGARDAPEPLQLPDVRAVGLERRAQDRRPALRLALERRDHRPGLLVLAPHQHARPRAGDRRAERAQRRRPLDISAERGYSCARYGWWRRSPKPPAIRSRSARASPSISIAAWATLKTASASGTDSGSAARAASVRDRLLRDDQHRLEPHRRLEPVHAGAVADDEPALQRGRDVVGVALELGRQLEDVGVELEHVVGGEQPGDDRGGARAEAAGQRDLRGDRELERRRPGAGARTPAPRGSSRSRGTSSSVWIAKAPGLLDLDLELQRQGRRQHVEARPEVGRRGGHANESPASAASPEHRLLDRAQVRVARDDRAGVLERDLRVLEPVAGEHADDPPRVVRAVRRAGRRRLRPTRARRRRPRWPRGSGRR